MGVSGDMMEKMWRTWEVAGWKMYRRPGIWTRISNSSSVLVITREPADSQGMLASKAFWLMVLWGKGCTILYYQ